MQQIGRESCDISYIAALAEIERRLKTFVTGGPYFLPAITLIGAASGILSSDASSNEGCQCLPAVLYFSPCQKLQTLDWRESAQFCSWDSIRSLCRSGHRTDRGTSTNANC